MITSIHSPWVVSQRCEIDKVEFPESRPVAIHFHLAYNIYLELFGEFTYASTVCLEMGRSG